MNTYEYKERTLYCTHTEGPAKPQFTAHPHTQHSFTCFPPFPVLADRHSGSSLALLDFPEIFVAGREQKTPGTFRTTGLVRGPELVGSCEGLNDDDLVNQ